MKNMKKKKKLDITLATSKKRRNYLVSDPGYHATKAFTKHLLATEMKNIKYLWINWSV